MSTTGPLRIFIGTEPSQVVAHQVLAHSIATHASIPVEITPMLDMELPVPDRPENRARVGFSFTRFLIPGLCGYKGRAVYLDADMLVFGDVAELASVDLDGNHVLCTLQGEPPAAWKDKPSFRPGRHTAVLVLDCSALPWHADEVVAGLDEGRYSYEELVHDLCIVAPECVADSIPREWNHLERYEAGHTRLLHYTVVRTQPWKNDKNPLAHLWTAAFAEALEAGAVDPDTVESGIAAGHLKPSLADFLHLAPGRRDPEHDLHAARDLALARQETARLQRQLDSLRQSRQWKIGDSAVKSLGAMKRLAERARSVRRVRRADDESLP